MAEFLKLKKSNCKNCYKCIRNCPVKSIRFSANQAHIVGNECILCGRCFVVCPQNAKEISDDIEKVTVMIAQGEKVIASIAPSFIANYRNSGIDGMKKALKQLGFFDVEETAVGATIVKKEYERILKENKPNVLISSCCHSVNLLMQKHYQNSLRYLANVVSPMQAHCLDIKKRYPDAKTVFIGPCVAKKDEAEHYKNITDAVLTFEELSRMLEKESITIEQQKDTNDKSRARFFPTTGGILKTMKRDQEQYTYLAVDGLENCVAALDEIEKGNIKNCFVEMSACAGSCINGPVMEKYHHAPIGDYTEVSSYAGKEDFEVENLEVNAIKKQFEFIDRKLGMPTENEIFTILRQMGKMKPSQELNCGSCGYNTCKEKAIAIYQGKADLTMCMPYLKDKAESFSANIINNTPDGMIILNENLEVQQINKEGCKILNIQDYRDLMGEPIIRVMDPTDFANVKFSGQTIHDKRIYLAEYERYVDETIVYDEDYKVLICMLKDVTEQETHREKREFMAKQTVEVADNVVEKQMRIVQEIASLLGETAAETKIALTKLKESIKDE